MQPKPLFTEGKKAELERMIREDFDTADFILVHVRMERQEGVCPDCGYINNPGHAVQAGGFCACNYAAPCYGQDEGHYPSSQIAGQCCLCGAQVPGLEADHA